MGLRDLEMIYGLYHFEVLIFMIASSVKALASVGEMYCLLTDHWPLGWLEAVPFLIHYMDLKSIVLLETS